MSESPESDPENFTVFNGLTYLSNTPIPVKQRFGAMVLFNQKSKAIAWVDKQGNAILAPNGSYTLEPANADLIKNAAQEECLESAHEKAKKFNQNWSHKRLLGIANSIVKSNTTPIVTTPPSAASFSPSKDIHGNIKDSISATGSPRARVKKSIISIIPLGGRSHAKEQSMQLKDSMFNGKGDKESSSKMDREVSSPLLINEHEHLIGSVLQKDADSTFNSKESIMRTASQTRGPSESATSTARETREIEQAKYESKLSCGDPINIAEQISLVISITSDDNKEILHENICANVKEPAESEPQSAPSHLTPSPSPSRASFLGSSDLALKALLYFSAGKKKRDSSLVNTTTEESPSIVLNPPPIEEENSTLSINGILADLERGLSRGVKKRFSNSHNDLMNLKHPSEMSMTTRLGSFMDMNKHAEKKEDEEMDHKFKKKHSMIFFDSPSREKNEEIYGDVLKVPCLDPLMEYPSKIINHTLFIYAEDGSGDVAMEFNLLNATAKFNRSVPSFTLTVTTPPGLELLLTTPTYNSMVCWIAVINSIASAGFSEKETAAAPSTTDLHLEIFDRHYFAIQGYLEKIEGAGPICDAEFHRVFLQAESEDTKLAGQVETAGVETAAVETVAETLVVKYESETMPKTPHHISAITLDGLIDVLTNVYGSEQSFEELVLYTYRAFTDGHTFFSKMMAKMNNKVLNEPDSYSKNVIIKLRVIGIVIRWMVIFWKPDFQRQKVRSMVMPFYHCICAPLPLAPDSPIPAYHALYTERFAAIQLALKTILETPPVPALPVKMSFEEKKKAAVTILDLDPDDMAAALASKEEARLKHISAATLMLHIWENQKDPLVAAQVTSIKEMVEDFNNMSYWVATEICTQPDIKNRTKVIEKLIKTASSSVKLLNFNTALAIISGLNLVSVSRLKATWELVDSKRMTKLHQMEDMLSPIGNYKAYRVAYEERDHIKPCIPVLSLLLKDLLFANDGNATFITQQEEKKLRLINMSKMKSITSMILNYTNTNQARTYNQLENQTPGGLMAQEYCTVLRSLKEQPLYKYSCLCEPKQGDTEALRFRAKWTTS